MVKSFMRISSPFIGVWSFSMILGKGSSFYIFWDFAHKHFTHIQTFFALLSNIFVEEFVDYFHMMDEKIMELRDKNRYRLKDHRERTIQTLFGEVTFQRRLYEDRTTGQTVYLLDQYLSIEERKTISPHLEEWAIRLVAERKPKSSHFR